MLGLWLPYERASRSPLEAEPAYMRHESHGSPLGENHHWADWFATHGWWTALIAGGVLCVIAVAWS